MVSIFSCSRLSSSETSVLTESLFSPFIMSVCQTHSVNIKAYPAVTVDSASMWPPSRLELIFCPSAAAFEPVPTSLVSLSRVPFIRLSDITPVVETGLKQTLM